MCEVSSTRPNSKLWYPFLSFHICLNDLNFIFAYEKILLIANKWFSRDFIWRRWKRNWNTFIFQENRPFKIISMNKWWRGNATACFFAISMRATLFSSNRWKLEMSVTHSVLEKIIFFVPFSRQFKNQRKIKNSWARKKRFWISLSEIKHIFYNEIYSASASPLKISNLKSFNVQKFRTEKVAFR